MPDLTQEQRDARAKGVGGSDVPIILGAVTYKTPVQLWLEKRGVEEPDDISDRINIRMGHLLEPVVVELFEYETGKRCRRQNLTRVHPVHPFMVGNVDRDIVGERAGFEAKAFSPWTRDQWGESGSGDVPLAVTAQCAHYMEIYGYEAWYVGVLLGIHDFRWYRLERAQSIIDKLIEVEREFWNHVIRATMPRFLNSEDIAKLHPRGEGSVLATPEVEDLALDYLKMKTEASDLERRLKETKFQLQAFMEGSGELLPDPAFHPTLEPLDQFKPLITWNHSVDRNTIDWNGITLDVLRLLSEVDEGANPLPALIEKHTKTKSPGPRSFLKKDKPLAKLQALREGEDE